jgi:hypothetical protein
LSAANCLLWRGVSPRKTATPKAIKKKYKENLTNTCAIYI